jgi:hypothetical protein
MSSSSNDTGKQQWYPMQNITKMNTISPNTDGTKPASYYSRGGYEYIINSMLLISIVGMCIKIFFGNNISKDGSYGRANSTIYGYGVVAFCILTVMFISFAIFDKIRRIEKKGIFDSIFQFIKTFTTSAMPSLLTIIVLLWIITLNVSFYTRINQGRVAKEYYQLSAGTSFLFMFQIIAIFQYLKTYIGIKTKTVDNRQEASMTMSRLAFATYFMCAINLVVVGMMTILLNFFSTDG